jgi:hypothetical protein
MNFLSAHDCGVGFREFRESAQPTRAPKGTGTPVLVVPEDAAAEPESRRAIA